MTTFLKTFIYRAFIGIVLAVANTLSAQIETLPFELLDNGHVVIQLQVNEDSEKRSFVLDTGATTDLLNKKTAEKLGIVPNYQQTATGASGDEVYDIALSQKLRLSEKVHIENTHLVLMDLEKLNSKSEREFDGIIGASLFKKHVSVIDFENQQLVLYNKIEEVDLNGFTPLPFVFDNFIPIPQFEMAFTLGNGEVVKGKVLYDSGAGLSFLFNTPFAETHRIVEKSEKSIKSVISVGLTSSEVTEQSVMLKNVELGGYSFNTLVGRITDSKSGVSSFEGYAGILGAQIIKRFTTILDYENKIIYLKPNAFFNESFQRPISGISLHKKEDAIYLNTVISSSPAYKKGLRAGDKVVSIDGVVSGNLKQYRKLLLQENKKVTIVVVSEEGAEKTVKIRLEPLL